VLPLRYVTDAARAALTGEDALSTVAFSSLVLLGFAALGSLVLLRVFRWSVRP
jgi:ABC-type multidrug transport system permease subunit